MLVVKKGVTKSHTNHPGMSYFIVYFIVFDIIMNNQEVMERLEMMLLMMMRVSDDGVEMVSSAIAVVILDVRSTMVTRNMNLQEAGNMIVVRLVMVLRLRMILKVRMVS